MAKKTKHTKAISSPASTGGAGNVFEQYVGAHWLALLLTGSSLPILQDTTVVEVHFQTEHLGWRTDDFLVVCENVSGNRQKLLGQVKRTFAVTASNEDFSKMIGDAWADFRNSTSFSVDADRIVFVVMRGTRALLEHFPSLLDTSRASIDATDFEARLRAPGFTHSKVRAHYKVLCTLLSQINGNLPSSTDIWTFLRILYVLNLDLTTSSGQTQPVIKNLLAQCAPFPNSHRDAQETWTVLLKEAADGIPQAKSFMRNTLPKALTERYRLLHEVSQGTVAATESRVTKLHGAIPLNNRKLIGREIVQREVVRLLVEMANGSTGASLNAVALHGMAGLGKTSLAVALAYDPSITTAFHDGVYWQSMGKRADPLLIIANWCERFGVPQLMDGLRGITENAARNVAAVEAGGRLRAFLLRADKRHLFILDDVWDAAHIRPLLMVGGRCASLITTRLLRIVEDFVPSGQDKRLSRLTDDESLALLLDIVGPETAKDYFNDVGELVGRLAGLPLALSVTGGLIVRARNRGHSIGELLTQLRERADLLLSQPVPEDVRQFLQDVENPNVVAVLQLSTDELDEQTRECFAVLGDVAPTNEGIFGLKWMSYGWALPIDQARAVADRLIEASLIQPAKTIAGEPFFYMHDLLKQHAKTMIQPDGE